MRCGASSSRCYRQPPRRGVDRPARPGRGRLLGIGEPGPVLHPARPGGLDHRTVLDRIRESDPAGAPPGWPMYHGRPPHSGRSQSMPNVSGSPQVTESIKLDGAVYASPIVVDG